jgi:microsomal dipeptidase-like Zn-dependent dipeptidase
MEMGHIDAAFLVAYQAQGERDDQSLQEASDFAFRRFRQIREQVALQEQRVGVATNTADLIRLKKEGKKAFFIAVENGYAMGKDLKNLERFKEEGVTYITLCHNGSNDLCDSAVGEPEWNGLSPLGKEAVKEMNRLGIMVDVSHASEATFYDVMKESSVPVIASHSSVRALCDHPRNLTDDQIRAIAAKGGVVQICLYNEFINPEPAKASIDDALEHIRYVVDLVGVDYVGIGSDFDGGGELLGCRSSNELIQITVKLLGLGYTEPEIEKIWGGNLLRVMNAVQQAAGVDQLSNN